MAILQGDSKAVIEACVDSLDAAIKAEKAGADRIELCADLDSGGLTPSESLLKEVLSTVRIPVKVMLRPRDGDFIFDASDKKCIQEHINLLLAHDCNRIVYGSLTNGRLDLDDLKAVYEKTGAEEMTIHKAIDSSTDPLKDVLELVKWVKSEKVNLSILSSGQADTALDGALNLIRMKRLCGNHIELIAAGKITTQNLAQIHSILGTPAYHGRRILQS